MTAKEPGALQGSDSPNAADALLTRPVSPERWQRWCLTTSTERRGRSRRVAIMAALGLCAGVTGVTMLASRSASADRVDTRLPAHIVVGAPRGACPMARVDQARTGRTPRLPDSPRQIWHRRVRGGLTLPPVVDEAGTIVVAAAIAELVQVAEDGREQWHRRLGMSVAAGGPVLSSSGTRLVLTALGTAWGFGPNGEERFQVDLGQYGTDPRTAPLPRDDGTVVIAIGRHLIIVDADGSLLDSADVGERIVGSLLVAQSDVVATTETGQVLRWRSPLPPRRVGAFRGIVRDGAALAAHNTLVTVVDMQRLASMDLRTGTVTTLTNLYGLEGPPAVGSNGLLHISTTSGSLLQVTPGGQEQRVKLQVDSQADLDAGIGDGGAHTVSFSPPSPAVIADEQGRVAFARNDGSVGVVSPQGRVALADKLGCVSPICVVPAGRSRFLVACRSGDIRLYGP
jgi:hypothetical protein